MEGGRSTGSTEERTEADAPSMAEGKAQPEIRRRRTEVFQKSLGPALAMAQQLGLSLPGTILTEQLLPRIMGIEDS